jgi:hypothetical protein
MAGGRAVALVYNEDKAELLRRLRAVRPPIFPPLFFWPLLFFWLIFLASFAAMRFSALNNFFRVQKEKKKKRTWLRTSADLELCA